MNNYLHDFIIQNKRRPTEAEVGALMKSVAMSEPGKSKNEALVSRLRRSAEYGAMGGRKKEPIILSENAMKINDLLNKKMSYHAICKILNLNMRSIRSIIKKQSLPRTKEMILNYQEKE